MVSAARWLDSVSPCSFSSSPRKCVLATPLAVGGGGREASGETGTLPEAVRRGEATPLAGWSEFMETCRTREGVAARESRPLPGLKELAREDVRALSADGDRSTAGL